MHLGTSLLHRARRPVQGRLRALQSRSTDLHGACDDSTRSLVRDAGSHARGDCEPGARPGSLAVRRSAR